MCLKTYPIDLVKCYFFKRLNDNNEGEIMITIYDWFGYDLPIEKRYQLIKEAGFDGVLLWWSNGFGRDTSGKNDYLNGPQLARDAGLYIENIHTPVQQQNDLWLDNLDGEALMNCYIQCIKDCSKYEIPTMVVHLPDDENKINTLGLDRMFRITEKAEKHGINVALENLKNFSNVKKIFKAIDSKRIGFCYDSCHHVNMNQDVDMLKLFGSRLMAVHLHDNGGSRNQHELPFEGNLDWPEIMGKIKNENYDGATALELMNWGYEDISAEQFLGKAYKRARILEDQRK